MRHAAHDVICVGRWSYSRDESKGDEDVWTEYERWNDAIAEVVFPELELPAPVYLDLDGPLLERLGETLDVAPAQVEDTLSDVVAATLRRHGGPASVFGTHMTRMRGWVRAGRTEPPPFLALLATFCMAAEQMTAADDMAANNYFGRLRAVLRWTDDDANLQQAYRGVAERLWAEHNRWLVEMDGRRGLPTAFALSHRYVGLSVSQALIRSADHERLKLFFRQYGFAPGADVPPKDLEPVLGDWLASPHCPITSGLKRLWKRGQARERIASAAAVALTSWDGRVSERDSDPQGPSSRGAVALTLETSTFPRRRFALSAVFYLPQPATPRVATVLTSDPPSEVELVPDLPGALGLGRESSLHAGDVLEGVLRVEDALSGAVLERRPRRLVVFREDDLSRRWIEAPQVMLGDNVRLLAHRDLLDRLRSVLDVVARPGWRESDAAPGQPDDWVVVDGLEVLSAPGTLVRPTGLDDLAPLVPLTTSQLKVAGGFALPGRVRGKWHSWAPPEVRAVSGPPGGFEVRVVDLHRFDDSEEPQEEELARWSDESTGVVVRSLGELGLTDGDYRLELVPAGEVQPISSTIVMLRSSDTPDTMLWARANSGGYTRGAGAVGIETGQETAVRGHVVLGRSDDSPGAAPGSTVQVPSSPSWRTGRHTPARVSAPLRVTVPDASSCIRTGRHVEQVDQVPTDSKGTPLEPWTWGTCRGCGLRRRYPTRLRRSSFGGRARKTDEPDRSQVRDLSSIEPATAPSETRDWATAFDALLHTGGGPWSQIERVALQLESNGLFVDQFARTLEMLGHIDVRRDQRTMQPISWEVAPTALAGTGTDYLFSGFWPNTLYSDVSTAAQDHGLDLAVSEFKDAPSQYFVAVAGLSGAFRDEVADMDVAVVDVAWRDLVSALPPLSEVLDGLPRQSDSLVGDLTRFEVTDASWQPVREMDLPGAYRVRRFATTDLVRTPRDVEEGTVARSHVHLSKHLAGLMHGRPLMAYERATEALVVPLGAELPGLYGRTVVAASGLPPVVLRAEGLVRYELVPAELAQHVYDLFSR